MRGYGKTDDGAPKIVVQWFGDGYTPAYNGEARIVEMTELDEDNGFNFDDCVSLDAMKVGGTLRFGFLEEQWVMRVR